MGRQFAERNEKDDVMSEMEGENGITILSVLFICMNKKPLCSPIAGSFTKTLRCASAGCSGQNFSTLPLSQPFNAYVIIFEPEPAKGVFIMTTEIDIDLKKHRKLSHNNNTGLYAVATFRRTSSLARTCRSEMLMPFS